ncbi:MAG: response regulator [Nitrospirae bacterium]|nr:response regulator [Nitrospirota bacterium]MBI5695701.1 response regulator [Nitrospirota bacterium]
MPVEKLPIRITVLHEGRLIGVVSAITTDGMSVQSATEFPRGKHIELGLSVPGALRPLPINVLVLDHIPGDGFEAGFVDMNAETVAAIRIILGKIADAAAQTQTKSAAPSGKKKVLLVEDTAQIRNVYKGRLMLDGYEATAVESAMEAIKYLRDELPDLVLLDLVMPVMDGFKLLSIIRETPRTAEVPVIILSAKGASAEIEKAMNMGISGYLIKTSTSPVKLSQEIREFFAHRG